MIPPGVTIDNGAVIGARAMLGRDVAPYAMITSNPAKSARFRFPKDRIAVLQSIAWWGWPEARVDRQRRSDAGDT